MIQLVVNYCILKTIRFMPQSSCNYIYITDVKLYSPDQFYVLFANKDCTLLGLLSLMWAETVQSNNIAIRAVLQV